MALTKITGTGLETLSDGVTITTADNTAQLTLISTDADANVGPDIILSRQSSSAADNDQVGSVKFVGHNDAGTPEDITYTQIVNFIEDATDGSEDGILAISSIVNGTDKSRLKFTGSEAVFNENSADLDFRVESDSETHALFIDDGGLHFGGTNNNPQASSSSSGGEAYFSTEFAFLGIYRPDSSMLLLNRTNSDGAHIELRRDGSNKGQIGVQGNRPFFSNNDNCAIRVASNAIEPATQTGAASDNAEALGATGARWSQLFAGTTTISTSDENEKQDITTITSAEITAAKAISKLFKTFKWKDAVASKGDSARIHTGVIAQQVQTAMTDAGLDATKYAFWCSDTWWETNTEVPAVKANTDAGIDVIDAYTKREIYHTEDEAPEGATKRTRLGIRYAELLAFIGAATEQRLTDIETRLAALENA